MMNKSLIFFLFYIGISLSAYGQKKIAITIDDVPNTRLYQANSFESPMLNLLDSLDIPVDIFINEGKIYRKSSIDRNFELLNEWCKRSYTHIANHSFNHARYSAVGLDSFKVEILKGTRMSKELARLYQKRYRYFRFPYNDMGKDSAQHIGIRKFLEGEHYEIAPFTIESSDWMYNSVYEYYLKKGDMDKAREIGEAYASKTLEYVDFFEKLCETLYGRPVYHIYLCHDNAVNSDYLDEIINGMTKRDYEFVSMEEAMSDPIYAQEDRYYKKWGISWIYRWMETQEERSKYMKQEPSTEKIQAMFNRIQKKRGE